MSYLKVLKKVGPKEAIYTKRPVKAKLPKKEKQPMHPTSRR